MGKETEKVGTLMKRYRKNKRRNAETNGEFYENLFANNWEVFIVRRDKLTGKLTWTTARSALAPI